MTTCDLHPDVDRPCHVCGIARVRAALAAAPRPATPAQPADTIHDLAAARARADRAQARKDQP